MYSLVHFGHMMRDSIRMRAYTEAIRRAVKPGSVVIDVGTGTGIFAFIACQAGAKHVYALDPNPLVEVGREISAANGFADRVTFIQDFTTRVELPEKADVIVGDVRGQLPLLDMLLDTYVDARKRLLKPDGVLIPTRDTLHVAMVSGPELYERDILRPWKINDYALNMQAALPMIVNSVIQQNLSVPEDAVLLPGKLWGSFEYGTPINPKVSGEFRWTAERSGTAHFLYVWFDTELFDGVGFSNAPGADRAKVYGSLFFPLAEPIDLKPGNVVTLALNADPVGRGHIYRWATQFFTDESASAPFKRFNQSTFFAAPLSNLIKRTATYKPRLNMDGTIHAFVLAAMTEGNATLEQIAHQALLKFPDYLKSYEMALGQVAEISQNFSA